MIIQQMLKYKFTNSVNQWQDHWLFWIRRAPRPKKMTEGPGWLHYATEQRLHE